MIVCSCDSKACAQRSIDRDGKIIERCVLYGRKLTDKPLILVVFEFYEAEIKLELQKRKHLSLMHQCRWLRAVVIGHFNYYGVPTNLRALNTFRFRVINFWMKALRDRSQNDHFSWQRMYEMSGKWLPWGHITHPYPLNRFGVKT